MAQRFDERDHAWFQDLLGAAAVGALTDDERVALAHHLATCSSCREELAALRAAAQALPLSLEEREPPPLVRARIQAAIQHELAQVTETPPRPASPSPRPQPLPPPVPIHRRSPWRLLPWAAAAVLLIASLSLLGWSLSLRHDLNQRPSEETIALQATAAGANAKGTLTYLPDRQVFVLTFDHLPSIGANQVFEVWLIRGKTPVPAGVFDANVPGYAVSGNRADFQTLAITIEPGPLGTTAPTTQPILAASL